MLGSWGWKRELTRYGEAEIFGVVAEKAVEKGGFSSAGRTGDD